MPRVRQTIAQGPTAAKRGKSSQLSEHIKKLLDDANDSSNAARNAWLAFLALVAYLLVTLAGISHKDLLLNSGVELPLVNVRIPLFSFFQYAPLLLLLVLLSLLIQHVMLARKYHKFVDALAAYETETRQEHQARELVHPYVVSQLLAGPKRNMVTRLLMRVMAFVTFALLPIVTLLYFQVKFIPYHEVWITYLHRIMVILGLVLLFSLLPIIQLKPRKGGIEIGPQEEAWRTTPLGFAIGAAIAILVIGFSWLVATVPDERLDRAIGFVSPTDQRDLLAHHPTRYEKLLLNPFIRFVYERIPQTQNKEEQDWLLPTLVSYRVLVVEDTDLVPDETDQHDEVSVVLRGRKLRFAKLNRSDLHRSDLTEADLRGAELSETRLEKAVLKSTLLEGADLTNVRLQEAKLSRARLQGASISDGELQGANLQRAKLQDAYLTGARLQGADLKYAELQNAHLTGASLQNADLSSAGLQGAGFEYAQLQGAILRNAKLLGATLRDAQLQGADLRDAKLQGADLTGAKLQGADLQGAKLQGATLESSELQGVHFGRADLSGADLRYAQLQGAKLYGAKLPGADLAETAIWLARFPPDLPSQLPHPIGLADLNMSAMTAEDKTSLMDDLRAKVADENLLERLIEKLGLILQDDPPFWWRSDENRWRDFISQAKQPSPDELARFMVGLVCNNPTESMEETLMLRADINWKIGVSRYQYAEPLIRALQNKNCETAPKAQ